MKMVACSPLTSPRNDDWKISGTARLRVRAFSLVELLVVIAIVATLLACLLPVASKMRERGRMVKCIGNMKEIGRALISYAADNNNYFPAVGDGQYFWPEAIVRYLGMPEPELVYYKKDSMFHCPSHPGEGDATDPSVNGSTYLMNLNVSSCPPAGIPGFPIVGKAQDSSKTLLLTESTGLSLWVNAAVSWDPRCFSPRHFGGMHILFLDCHIEYRKGTILPSEDRALGLID